MARNRVYVGELPPGITEDEVARAFERFGRIDRVSLKQGDGRGAFAFMTFDSEREAEEAVRTMDASNFQGKRIRVEVARAKTYVMLLRQFTARRARVPRDVCARTHNIRCRTTPSHVYSSLSTRRSFDDAPRDRGYGAPQRDDRGRDYAPRRYEDDRRDDRRYDDRRHDDRRYDDRRRDDDRRGPPPSRYEPRAPPQRTNYRVIVTGIGPDVQWMDLKVCARAVVESHNHCTSLSPHALIFRLRTHRTSRASMARFFTRRCAKTSAAVRASALSSSADSTTSRMRCGSWTVPSSKVRGAC